MRMKMLKWHKSVPISIGPKQFFVAMSHYRNGRNHWKNGQFFPSKGIDATQNESRKYDGIRIKGSECRCRQRTAHKFLTLIAYNAFTCVPAEFGIR